MTVPRLPLTVLVAEDNELNQQLACLLLERWGHRALAAANGIEALDQHSRQQIDVILMDVQMPEMDGIEATRRIRQRERDAPAGAGARVIIVAMTAGTQQQDRAACMAAGMDEFLAKPLDMDALHALMARLAARQGDGPVA